MKRGRTLAFEGHLGYRRDPWGGHAGSAPRALRGGCCASSEEEAYPEGQGLEKDSKLCLETAGASQGKTVREGHSA